MIEYLYHSHETSDQNCTIYTALLQILLPESEGPDDTNGVATLTVLRTRNTVGDITVYWKVREDGRMDLEPSTGNLTFREVYTHCSNFFSKFLLLYILRVKLSIPSKSVQLMMESQNSLKRLWSPYCQLKEVDV